jgi:glycine dehydrogenase subunit 1
MAIVAALHLALLGPDGLRAVARRCHANMQRLRRLLETVPGIRLPFDGPCFHETVVQWRPEGMGAPSVPELLAGMEQDGIAAGFALGTDYPELADGWLVCTTEQHSAEDHQRYRTSLLEHGGNAWAA